MSGQAQILTASQAMILEDGSMLQVVHFAYQVPAGLEALRGVPLAGPLTWRLACAPNLGPLCADASRPFPYPHTDDVRAASCPLCRGTEAYRAAAVQLRAALARGRAAV